mgnify:CR=1 FL=1
MKIAVVGSGISGLSAAYYLSKKHHVDLFEKNDHFGGHSYTVEISTNNLNSSISIDLGFGRLIVDQREYFRLCHHMLPRSSGPMTSFAPREAYEVGFVSQRQLSNAATSGLAE